MSTQVERYVESGQAEVDALRWLSGDTVTADQLTGVLQVWVICAAIGVPRRLQDVVVRCLRPLVEADAFAGSREHVANSALEVLDASDLPAAAVDLLVDVWLDTTEGQDAADDYERPEDDAA